MARIPSVKGDIKSARVVVELTVLTQNIWGKAPGWPRRRERLVRRWSELQPDVIALQEVLGRSTELAESQAHGLAARLGSYRVVFAPAWIGRSGVGEGVALLSRMPILRWSSTKLARDDTRWLDRIGQRVVLRAVVDVGGAHVEILNTHLSLSRAARMHSIGDLLASSARERADGPVAGSVLAGDLNASPSEVLIAIERAGERWADAWTEAGRPRTGGRTWPAPLPWRRIDFVLARRGTALRVVDCTREPACGSDHKGVLARLAVER